MSAFTPEWLRLREPADAAARGAHALEARLPAPPPGSRWHIVDLGAGTGANLRYLAPRLGAPQDWCLLDRDPRLLAMARDALTAWAAARDARLETGPRDMRVRGADVECRIRCRPFDLATKLGALELPAGGLVSASALLDLVAEPWLRALAGRCRAAGAPILFALSYDGRIECAPADPDDAWIRDLVNRHQRRDKGFGPAMGPDAPAAAELVFAAAGYTVQRASSDWLIEPGDRALQRALLDGWCAAACEIEPASAARARAWAGRRAAYVAQGRSRLRVGHVDLLGVPG